MIAAALPDTNKQSALVSAQWLTVDTLGSGAFISVALVTRTEDHNSGEASCSQGLDALSI